MATAAYRSWVEISRDQLAHNYRTIRSVVGSGVEVMPVVKADAYRHGATEVAATLEAEGARWLAVSNVEEGVQLRGSGAAARILVMADFLPGSRSAMLDERLTPVLHNLEDIAEFDRLAAARGVRAPYHLKIDSGMGRLGTCADAHEIAAAVRAAAHVELEGLMTHFASVGDFCSDQTERQIACFDEVVQALRDTGIQPRYLHMGSTGAVAFGRRATWHNLVRSGLGIYGYTSPPSGRAPENLLGGVRPALTWKAAVLAVKDLAEGSLIGYGGLYRAPKPMRIAVVAAGYADGLPHRLSNRGHVIACGRMAPIVGAISMDVTTIDATECQTLRVGDTATLLGSEGDVTIDAQTIASLSGTISYSVLCAISARVRRVYV